MTGRTDALGRTTSYVYNSLGQKTSMIAPPQTAGGTGAATGYQYDAFGNLTETDAPLGSWNYNADDELSSETYDQDGQVARSSEHRGFLEGSVPRSSRFWR